MGQITRHLSLFLTRSNPYILTMLSHVRDRCVTLGELTLTERDTLRLYVTVSCIFSWQGVGQMGNTECSLFR